MFPLLLPGLIALAAVAGTVALVAILLGVRRIPTDRVGIVEKLWSGQGSVGLGHILAIDGEAGYQSDVLRGGLHLGYGVWQYRVNVVPLVVVAPGKIGYVFARDGEPLKPQQTLGRVVECDNFQDARAFLTGNGDGLSGQRGRQRAILREGVYAINLAAFVVITEDRIWYLEQAAAAESGQLRTWHGELLEARGFEPVIIGCAADACAAARPKRDATDDDSIGVVTVHDGPALEPGQIIAPPVGTSPGHPSYHNSFQDPEAFLRAGGRRGRQYPPLTDGTYFLNRWFVTAEHLAKTVVPIGHVGVVVSYFGRLGTDLSGVAFRHGERVAEGEVGVWSKTLGPGKYAFNTYAGQLHLVPTTNFVLHWITGRTESHRYDESLKSIDLVTADAFEPVLPLSIVVHIDYEKAPGVVQRFGDVKRLITQTIDPLLSAYFRDIAHKKTMLDLLHHRDEIQHEAVRELRARFQEFDIELVDVLIGRPDTEDRTGPIETLLEQLRQRQLAREQVETYERQRASAVKLLELRQAQAQAEKQTELTNSQVEIEVGRNRAEAELVRARKQAEQTVVTAEAEARQKVLLAESEGQARALLGEGEGKRVSLEGAAEARVLEQKVASFGDSRLYALCQLAQFLSKSAQPLVPERLFVAGADGAEAGGAQGLLATLVSLLVAERAGFAAGGDRSNPPTSTGLKRTADQNP